MGALLKDECGLNCVYFVRGERSSAGRASVCGTEGRGFKPRRSPQNFNSNFCILIRTGRNTLCGACSYAEAEKFRPVAEAVESAFTGI
jgi:hypothetical protein